MPAVLLPVVASVPGAVSSASPWFLLRVPADFSHAVVLGAPGPFLSCERTTYVIPSERSLARWEWPPT